MQIVYILVSDDKDYYYEQCLVSITSLLMHMPNCSVNLIIDDNTFHSLKGKRESLKGMVSNIIMVNFSSDIKKKERSRILKTSMKQYIEGDFLFIDCDTVVCESLSDIQNCKEIICAVTDNHTPLDQNVYAKDMLKRAKICGFHASYRNLHYNSGIIWVKDCNESDKFFKLWNELWEEGRNRGILSDQLSFNEANFRMNGIITEMNGIWNCQIDFGIRFIHEAKVIHYLGFNPKDDSPQLHSKPYRLADRDFLEEIKQTGTIGHTVQEILESPKGERAINPTFTINSNRAEVDIFHGALISCIRIPYNKVHWLYNGLDCFARGVRSFWKHRVQKREI